MSPEGGHPVASAVLVPSSVGVGVALEEGHKRDDEVFGNRRGHAWLTQMSPARQKAISCSTLSMASKG